MALDYTDIMGEHHDKVQIAIDRIKAFAPPEGYFVAFSGGKDSSCILHLAKMAGVPYDAHYNVTTVDPPELVHFIRDKHPEVIFDRPRYSMRQLIIRKNIPPTRFNRYCCAELKESQGKGRVVITGTRWAESNKRKEGHGVVTVMKATKRNGVIETAMAEGANFRLTPQGGLIMNMDNDPARRTVELCYRTQKTLLNPIIDWTDEDVWEFIHNENLPYCKLYDEGFTRLGCIGCPVSAPDNRKRDFERWPYMYRMYLHAFKDMLEKRRAMGKEDLTWHTAQDVMDWWLGDRRQEKPIDGQTSIDDITQGPD